jgi:23S rRNA pseudouridine1911/1915/1917 synthase
VLVDGSPRAKSHRLTGGSVVELSAPVAVPSSLEPEAMELRIAYEDEHLLVVDKPAGVVVHPAAGHARGTLVHGLLGHAVAGGEEPERPGIVHRLDRDTSGLLVVARSAEAHRRLQALIRRRAVERHYLALVVGRPLSRTGSIEAPIGRDRHDPTRQSLDTATPRDAVTHFSVVELLPRHAFLDVRLETGRTHQIRVHLAAIDLPVAGDPVYGRAGELDLERQFLHAARLAFPHPFTGEQIETESPLPPDLARALASARASAANPGASR